MKSECSSPSTSGPSSPDTAIAANMEMEVDNGTEIASQELDKMEMTSILQPMFASYNKFLAAGTSGLQGLFSTMANTPKLEKDPVVNSPGTVTQKKVRSKIFINGYFMTFDKISCNRDKKFWRCEYKNTCKARFHTSLNTEKEHQFIHEHNHSKTTDEEIKLYGLDPSAIVQNKVYEIDVIADTSERRKIRKQVALKKEAAVQLEQQKQMAAAYIQIKNQSAKNAMVQAELLARVQSIKNVKTEMPDSVEVSPNRNSQNPSSSSLFPPAPSIPSSCPTETPKRKMSSPIRKEVLERIEQSLQTHGMPKPSRHPRNTANPTIYFEFYVSKYDEMSEHKYIHMRIEHRDETLLKEALELFCGQKCIGMPVFGISPKIKAMLNQFMLRNWENNQFFLLDISNTSEWCLLYVDIQKVTNESKLIDS